MDKSHKLSVLVRNSESVLYQGDALALSSINEKGPFDILPLHSNFISIVELYIRIRKMDQSVEEIPIDRAILKVAENKVYVLCGINLEENP